MEALLKRRSVSIGCTWCSVPEDKQSSGLQNYALVRDMAEYSGGDGHRC
jgi:hypothetical protein